MKPFKWVTCHNCNGAGQVGNYGAFGRDFQGPDECRDCGGSGRIAQYESGTLAAYPGGPLLGRTLPDTKEPGNG